MSSIASVSQSQPLKRLELQTHILEFQRKLGPEWDKYHETLSLFLIGKLSRNELVERIKPLLKNGLMKYHNKLLLLNFANSLKDGPIDGQNEFAAFWNKRASKSKNVKSSHYEKFKQNIMGLQIKERRRIKNITRDSGKKGKLTASITLTRHSLLPKIPMIQDKEQQQLQVNNLVQWQQDVVNGINTPISTQCYELPDYDNLSRRILMTMREHGLTGGLNTQVLDILMLGLEIYLKNVIESSIDVVKYRENKYGENDFISVNSLNEGDSKKRQPDFEEKITKRRHTTLNIEDIYDTFEMYPHLMEYSGPKIRLPTVMLQNDDIPYDDFSDVKLIIKGKGPSIKNTDSEDKLLNNMIKIENADGHNLDSKDGQTTTNQNQTQKTDLQFGTTDELKCIIHDLVSTM